MSRFTRSLLICAAIAAGVFAPVSFAKDSSFVSEHGLAYDLQGHGDTVVFIHGSNLDRRMWAEQIEHFSKSTKTLAYDLRGLGSSNVATQAYSDAQDLALLLEELGESNPVIVGLSAGAQVALDFALSNPAYVGKLVLVSPSLNGFAAKQNPAYLTDLMSALKQRDFAGANRVLLESQLMSVATEHSELVGEMVNSSGQWLLPYELMQASKSPAISNLAKVNNSTLIMLGANDIAAIQEIGNYLHAELPNSNLEIIIGGHHLLNLSKPSEFNRLLTEFLKD